MINQIDAYSKIPLISFMLPESMHIMFSHLYLSACIWVHNKFGLHLYLKRNFIVLI